MATSDKREPAVYVTIEDNSYVAPVDQTGRGVYAVILCEKGPHNRLVKVSSKDQFYSLFGKPNYRRCSQTVYQIDRALTYTGNVLVTRVVPEDSYLANVYIKENSGGVEIPGSFIFNNGSNTVIVSDEIAFNSFTVGDWIYGTGDPSFHASGAVYGDDIIEASPEYAAQIVSTDKNNLSFTLDRNYMGPDQVDGTAIKFSPYEIQSMTNVDTTNLFTDPDGNVVYYFYANGAGKYYNNIVIRGIRNTNLEYYNVDPETGEPLFKYIFMDIAVYEKRTDGSTVRLEGPWTVSLIPRYPDEDGSPVIDPTSGRNLYIENVINDESNLIRCISSVTDPSTGEINSEFPAITNLVEADDAEDRRLRVMLMLSSSTPVSTNNIPYSSTGLEFANGTDGTGLYNASGNYSPNAKLYGLVSQAYSGSLNRDISEITEDLFPVYLPDYIVCGGYPASVQYFANQLATNRGDCICLADTGSFYTSYDKDLKARQNDVPWNSWNSMLYVQYQRITDEFTGQKIWMSPVYTAIDRHLWVDTYQFIADPVAGIDYASVEYPVKLAYTPNHTERGDLLEANLNCIIDEPEGRYINTQFTTYKRYSILRRGHAAKFVAYCKKNIPPLLKPLLNKRATNFWVSQAQTRCNYFLGKFIEGPIDRYSIISSYSVAVEFDEIGSELNVIISIKPIRSIERINVTISVS